MYPVAVTETVLGGTHHYKVPTHPIADTGLHDQLSKRITIAKRGHSPGHKCPMGA